MENASGEGEQECWFEEEGCTESSEMENGSWRDFCQSGVNPAIPVYGDKPGSKLELIITKTKVRKQQKFILKTISSVVRHPLHFVYVLVTDSLLAKLLSSSTKSVPWVLC